MLYFKLSLYFENKKNQRFLHSAFILFVYLSALLLSFLLSYSYKVVFAASEHILSSLLYLTLPYPAYPDTLCLFMRFSVGLPNIHQNLQADCGNVSGARALFRRAEKQSSKSVHTLQAWATLEKRAGRLLHCAVPRCPPLSHNDNY